MRNNQNLPNRKISSNNVNGRQLPSTSPVYSNHEVEHLTETVDTQVSKVIEPILVIIIIVDTRVDHTAIIDHTATIDLIVMIDHKTDMKTITETDHRVITETILTETIQITEIVVIASTEIIETIIIVVPTVQFQIIVITKDTIHDHHINFHDHRTSVPVQSPYQQ